MKFIDLCDSLHVLLLILPSYSTHRLQPFNVSLFASLANFYTQGLNRLLSNSLGMVSMSKRASGVSFGLSGSRLLLQRTSSLDSKKPVSLRLLPRRPGPCTQTRTGYMINLIFQPIISLGS